MKVVAITIGAAILMVAVCLWMTSRFAATEDLELVRDCSPPTHYHYDGILCPACEGSTWVRKTIPAVPH